MWRLLLNSNKGYRTICRDTNSRCQMAGTGDSGQLMDWFTTCLYHRRRIFTVRRSALHGICDSNSVCLSVCLSVTLVDCVHIVRPTIVISSPYGSIIILVSADIKFIPKFEGDHPERGRWMGVGWVRIGDFRPISRRISETVRDDKGYY